MQLVAWPSFCRWWRGLAWPASGRTGGVDSALSNWQQVRTLKASPAINSVFIAYVQGVLSVWFLISGTYWNFPGVLTHALLFVWHLKGTHFLSLWNVKSCVSVNLWWLAVLLTLPFPLLIFLIWQLLLEVCWSPTVTAMEANSPWSLAAFLHMFWSKRLITVMWSCGCVSMAQLEAPLWSLPSLASHF